jgi:hypothetical protein
VFGGPTLGGELARSTGACCRPFQVRAIGGAGQRRRPADGLGPRCSGGHSSTGAAKPALPSLGSAQWSRRHPSLGRERERGPQETEPRIQSNRWIWLKMATG